jgi:hypothetical protein
MKVSAKPGLVIEKSPHMRAGIVAAIPLTLLLGTFCVATSAAGPIFAAPFFSFDAGSRAVSVAIGDLNGDGKPDLAVANAGGFPDFGNTVSVLLGNGDGTFGPKSDFGTGTSPGSVAIADLNGDGSLDLAVANGSSNTVSVLLGDGDGTFGPKSDFGTGTGPGSVTIADLNADGKPDLATANNSSNTVSVLLGNGDGTFAPKSDFGTGASPRSVAIGDLNGDGKPDLVTANSASWSNTVSVLLGNGNGTFGPKSDYGAGAIPRSVAIGDLNADGKPDLVTANAGFGPDHFGTVSVLLGNGNGTFGPKSEYGTGTSSQSVAIGDLNGDGKPDLAVANYSSSNTVSVLLGNGDGTFGIKSDYGTGPSPSSLAIGDFNGDGIRDLVVTNSGASPVYVGSVSVLLGNGDGIFGPQSDYGVGLNPQSVAIGDLNADGKPDLAVVNYSSTTISVLLGIGGGTFGTRNDFGTGLNPRSVAIGDLNADGKPDLAVVNAGPHTVSVLLGNGDGTFGPKSDFATGSGPFSVAIGDLNADGRPDLATANFYADTVSVLLGHGDGTYEPKSDFATGSGPRSVAIADLNEDGKPDLAVANSFGNTVSVLLGNGNGTFGTKSDYATGNGPRSVAIADLNGDGKPDLATANVVVAGDDFGTVSVLMGNGDGTFGSKNDFGTGLYPYSVAIADLNADGKPDLAVANANSNTISVLLGNGNGTFGTKSDYGTASGPRSVAIADLDGDGRRDLAVANSGSDPDYAGTVSVLLNVGPVVGVPPVLPTLPVAFKMLAPRPNPSHGATQFRFVLPAACAVDADLVDVAGRRVRSLGSGHELPPGEHLLLWDGRDGGGRVVPDGIYLVRIRAGRDMASRKTIHLR